MNLYSAQVKDQGSRMPGKKLLVTDQNNKRCIMSFPVFLLFLILILSGISCSLVPSSGDFIDLTKEEKEWLFNNPEKLVLYFDWKFPPVEFYSSGGQFTGLGADVIKAVEKRLGYQIRRIVSRDWVKQLSELESGSVPVAPVIVRTDERENYAFFTKPYAEIPVVIITASRFPGKLTMQNLDGMKVAVVNEYATEAYVRGIAAGRFEIIEVENIQEGLRRVSFGEVDVLIDNLAVVFWYIEKEGLANLRVAGITDLKYSFSIAVSRKYPLLYSAINKSLAAVPENQLRDIYRKWIKLPGLFSRETVLVIKLAAVFTILLFVLLAGITLILRKRLNEKVKSLRKSDEMLRKSEALSKAVMDQSFQLLALLDTQGRILIFNKTALDFTGHKLNKVIGKYFWDGSWWKDHDEAEKFIKKAMNDASSGIVTRTEIVNIDRYKLDRILDFSFSPFVNEEGNIVHFIAEGRDITQMKQMEKEKEKLQEQLIHTRKMDAIGQLAGGIAHDFNNMLGAILGAGELLTDSCKGDETLLNYCRMITLAAERAGQLTGKLLDFSRKGKTVSVPVDIHRIIDDAASILERSIDKRIKLCIVKNAGNTIVAGDPSQLQNMLLNIGLNARDAMPDGGEICFKTEEIIFSSEDCGFSPFDIKPGKYIRIKISDTGPGIDPEIIDKIFEPFFTTKESGKGTGLGLSAVYGTVCDHGGAVTAGAGVAGAGVAGAVFSIDLPLSVNTGSDITEQTDKKTGRGETVLVIDDEVLMLSAASMLIKDLGYSVLTANNGIDGIAVFREKHNELLAVICDMVMPVISGLDTLKAMRDIDKNVPLIICSGYRNDALDPLAAGSIADAFLHKPYHRSDMAAVLMS